jgi:hypothetical protein
MCEGRFVVGRTPFARSVVPCLFFGLSVGENKNQSGELSLKEKQIDKLQVEFKFVLFQGNSKG